VEGRRFYSVIEVLWTHVLKEESDGEKDSIG